MTGRYFDLEALAEIGGFSINASTCVIDASMDSGDTGAESAAEQWDAIDAALLELSMDAIRDFVLDLGNASGE